MMGSQGCRESPLSPGTVVLALVSSDSSEYVYDKGSLSFHLQNLEIVSECPPEQSRTCKPVISKSVLPQDLHALGSAGFQFRLSYSSTAFQKLIISFLFDSTYVTESCMPGAAFKSGVVSASPLLISPAMGCWILLWNFRKVL
jgi:hypothetical protein